MKLLVIAYGCSGSGKSTLCRKTATKYASQGYSAVILSTDELITSRKYHSQKVTDDNIYKKDNVFPLKMSKENNTIEEYVVLDDEIYTWSFDGSYPSHKLNQIKCRCCMEREIPVIIIDNTNLTFKEIEPYVEHAVKFGYEIDFIKSDTSWACDESELFNRNLHRVPEETIKRQLDKFLKIDINEWKEKVKNLQNVSLNNS